jgi:hypothetical protein
MRKCLLLIAVALAAVACNDTSGPDKRPSGIRLISGFNVTDTVGARPTTALLVEVRDTTGALVPLGTVVRFTGVPSSTSLAEMLVENLTSTSFSTFAAAATDAAGRAGVLVQFGQVAGPMRVVNSDGTNQRAVTSSNRTYVEGPISWTSDSKWLLARSNVGILDLIEVETGQVLPLPYSASYSTASLK